MIHALGRHLSPVTPYVVDSRWTRVQHSPMDAISTVALVAGLGWASGMRLYAVLFFLGVIHHSGAAALPASLQVLAHPAVMAVSGALFAIEFFVDKLPGFDTLWDTVHTFVRIPAGAVLAPYRLTPREPCPARPAGPLGAALPPGTPPPPAGRRCAAQP